MFYRQDETRDDVIWIRVPITADRTPTSRKNADGSWEKGAGKNIPLYKKEGFSERLYAKMGDFGPEGEPFKVDGEEVRVSVTLQIPNPEYVEPPKTDEQRTLERRTDLELDQDKSDARREKIFA